MTRLLDYPELQAVAQARRPRVALVLGSGLSDLADRLADVVELPFGCAPGLDAAGVRPSPALVAAAAKPADSATPRAQVPVPPSPSTGA